MFRDTTTRDIDVGTTVLLVRENDAHSRRPVSLLRYIGRFELSIIVVVDDGDVTDALIDRFYLATVIALRPAGQIVDDALCPFLRTVLALGIDEGSNQRAVIDVTPRPRTNAALPFGIDKVFIPLDQSRIVCIPRHDDHAGTFRKREPAVIGVPKTRGNILPQNGGIHGRQQVLVGVNE